MNNTVKYLLHRIEALEGKLQDQKKHIENLEFIIDGYDNSIVERLVNNKEKAKSKFN